MQVELPVSAERRMMPNGRVTHALIILKNADRGSGVAAVAANESIIDSSPQEQLQGLA